MQTFEKFLACALLATTPMTTLAQEDTQAPANQAAPAAVETAEPGSESQIVAPKVSIDSNQATLPETVVTATRAEANITSLPMSVSVITREELTSQTTIDRDLSDILGKTTPGFSPGTQALSTFGQTLRGRDFLVLIDGIPQSTPLRSASRDLNTIDPDAIERIEVIRGGTAIYGFGATGGIVNILTREPEADRPFAAYSEAGLSFSTEHSDDSLVWHTTQRASGTAGEFDYLVSGTFVQRGGSFDSKGDRRPPDPLGVQGGLDDSDIYDILAKFGYDFDGDRQRVELMVNHFSHRQDTNYTFGTGNPAQNVTTPAVRGQFNVEDPGTDDTVVNLEYLHRDVAGSQVKLQLYYQDIVATFAKFPGFAQTEVVADKFGSRLTIDTPLDIGNLPLTVVWGLDYQRDNTVQEGIDGPTIVPEMSQHALAGFAQLEFEVTDWLLLRGGVRHEVFWLDVDDVVNRAGNFIEGGDLEYSESLFNVGAVVDLNDHLSVYGGYSQGYALADIGRVIRDTAVVGVTAEDIDPEAQKVDNFELGLRGHWDKVTGSVVGFYSQTDHGTTYNASDLRLVRRPEQIYGVEGALTYDINEQWTVGGTATWMEGVQDFDDDGDYESHLDSTRIPPVKLTLYVEHQTLPWWRNRLQGLYSGDRTRDDIATGYDGEVNDYFILDYYAMINVGPGHLRVGVENLLNEEYFPVVNQTFSASYSYVRGPGRTVSLVYGVEW